MPVFQVTVVGAVNVPGVTKVKFTSGSFITSSPDGPTQDQFELWKRDIVAALGVPAYEVTFEMTCEEASREQHLTFANAARTNAEIAAPKPKPRPRPGPRLN